MATNLKLILEKEVIVIDSSSEGEMDGKEEEMKKKKKDGGGSESRSEYSVKTKAEEYKMLADLSSFPGLATMLAAEVSMREKNRKRNQIRRLNKKLKKVNGGEVRNDDSGANQLVPSESGTVKMLSTNDTEKLKIVNNCKPEDKTVSRCSFDDPQGSIASGVPLSSSGEKTTREKCCGQVQLDLASTEVFVGEAKSNEEQYKVADDIRKVKIVGNCTAEDKTVLESPVDGLQPPIVSRRPLSSLEGKRSGHNYYCRIQWDSVAEVFLGKSNEEQDKMVDDTEKAKTINNCEPDYKNVQNSCNGLQHHIESGSPLSSSSGGKMTGDSRYHRLLLDSIATKEFVGKEKSNDEQDNVVHDKGKEKLVDPRRDMDRSGLFETKSVNRTHNLVLQKLTQPLRYFSPQASTWITCHWCGEGNHIAAQCSKRKRKKPCFICADPGHRGKKCLKVNNCFICHRKGHLAMDCPQKDVEEDPHSKSCLRCGDSVHDMFSCDNTYCSDDLKKIQCCVCKEFGHLCCLDYAAEGPRLVSCYACGKSGHLGSDCTEFNKNASSSQLASPGNKHEEKSPGAQQMQYIEAGEEGNFPTLMSAEKRDGATTAESRAHLFVEADRAKQNAQKQRVNVTQGWRWPRRNNAQRQRVDVTQGRCWPRRKNAQRQRVKVTQGWQWPRRNLVWVRVQQPQCDAQQEVPCPSVLKAQ